MKFEKTYLSRAMTRTMASHGMPIGDPTGGPAYGERRDPVSAVMAVASMWEAGTIIAGASSLAAGFEALTVAQGLMFAGGALNLVGNVTGNKNLMILGGAVALGGGIGGLMSDAGTGFNQTFSDAFSSTPAAPTAGLAGSPVGSDLATGSQATGTQAPANDVLRENITSNMASEAPAASTSPSQSLNNPAAAAPDMPASAVPVSATSYATENVLPLTPAQVNAPPANTFGQTPGSSQITPGIIDKAMAFAKEQPMAAMVLGQAAGGVATGVMDMASGKTAAQTEQLKADAAYRKSIADKTNRDSVLQASRIAQINANLKAQYPQMNVNQSAVTMGQQQPVGLIANARG
jgi:hypothetical protein